MTLTPLIFNDRVRSFTAGRWMSDMPEIKVAVYGPHVLALDLNMHIFNRRRISIRRLRRAGICVDLGGSREPWHVPPIIENRPCIYHFLPPFAPQYFGLPTQYFCEVYASGRDGEGGREKRMNQGRIC